MTKKLAPLEPLPMMEEGLLRVRAGEAIVLSIGALDRQTGIAEIRAVCRSRENHDLVATGAWKTGESTPVEHYYSIRIPIPAFSPTVVWELKSILLQDGQGNRRTYTAGRDYDEFLFQVEGLEGVDSTPPRLLGIRVDPI
jgi:hypothetical protein